MQSALKPPFSESLSDTVMGLLGHFGPFILIVDIKRQCPVPRQSGDTEPRNLMIFLEMPFFNDIVRCLVVYTYANDKSGAFEHDS